jgi:hypothetical protein
MAAHRFIVCWQLFEVAKDFREVTINPKWGETFHIPLPCPRNLILHTAASGNYGDNSEHTALDMSKALLSWWGEGYIKIAVVDGDRFNQDIFMGEATLLMSSFLVPVKGKERLETNGMFPLNKVQPTDRVSGSIKLHAYLHLPEMSYLLEGESNPVGSSAVASSSQQGGGSSGVGSKRSTTPTSSNSKPSSFQSQLDFEMDSYYEQARPKRAVNSNNLDDSFVAVPITRTTPVQEKLVSASKMGGSGANVASSSSVGVGGSAVASKGRSAQMSSVARCLDSLASLEFLDVNKLVAAPSLAPPPAVPVHASRTPPVPVEYRHVRREIPANVEAYEDDNNDNLTVATGSTASSSSSASTSQYGELLGDDSNSSIENHQLDGNSTIDNNNNNYIEHQYLLFKRKHKEQPSTASSVDGVDSKAALRKLKERQSAARRPHRGHPESGLSAQVPLSNSVGDGNDGAAEDLDDVVELHTISLLDYQNKH